MWKHNKEFTGGAIMGGITGGGFIFSQPDLLNTFFIAFIIKLFATGLLAGVSGFATILMTDFYKHRIQKQLFKQKKDGEQRKDGEKALGAALIAVKEENKKTEASAEKRFELLNELRSGVATRDQLHALEKIVDDLKTSRDQGEGKDGGIQTFIGWIAAAIAVIGFIITNIR